MICLCDLHLHTTASDGQYHPAELVRLAKEKGLQTIAITDHDTADGVDEAVQTGKELGLRVIPGIEMSAREYKTYHILGYGMNIGAACFQEITLGRRAGRGERGERITKYLNKKGIPVSYSEVQELAEGAMIGRPHFARVILRHGWCATWEEVFDNYLDTDEFHETVEDKPPVRECIDAILEAGGKVSLAHPYQIGLKDDELENLVFHLKDWGLEAIECYHSGHTQEQISFYLYLASKYGLIVTGGSDFHGELVKVDRPMVKLTLDIAQITGVTK